MEFLFLNVALLHSWQGTETFIADHMDLCTRLNKMTLAQAMSYWNEQNFNFVFSAGIMLACLHFDECKNLLCFPLFSRCSHIDQKAWFWGSFHMSNLCCHQPYTPTGKKLHDKALCLASSVKLSWRQQASTLISLFWVPLMLSDPLCEVHVGEELEESGLHKAIPCG